MTLRLSSSRRSENRQIHRGRKKLIKFAAMSSPCWSFFWHPRHCPQGIRIPGQTVNGKFYYEDLSRLSEGIRRKRPDKWQKTNSFLHHENAPAHTSLVVRQFLIRKNIAVNPTPQSPDLVPCDFFIFPKMKLRLKGRRFDTTEENHAETQEVIDTLTFENFTDARNHGKHAGIAVYMHKGNTSKETVETRSYSKKKCFMVKFPHFLGSPTYVI